MTDGSALNPHPHHGVRRCWRCGRAITGGQCREFVYGSLCERAECRRVASGLSTRFKIRTMLTGLPAGSSPGASSVWNHRGEVSVRR